MTPHHSYIQLSWREGATQVAVEMASTRNDYFFLFVFLPGKDYSHSYHYTAPHIRTYFNFELI